MLSLGKYTTEMDALKNATPRKCLEKVRLISTDTDEDSRRRDVANLLHAYIVKQLVFLPNSVRKSDGFITQARQIMEDVIMRNKFPLFEIPFLTTDLYTTTEEKHVQFWNNIKKSQLDSIMFLWETLQVSPPDKM